MHQFSNLSKLEMQEGLEMIYEFTTEEYPRIPQPAWKAETQIPRYLQEKEEQEYESKCEQIWKESVLQEQQDSSPFSFDTEYGAVDLGYYEEVYGA